VTEIVPGIFQLSGWWDQADLGANVYLIAAGRDLVLVDAGFKGKEIEILRRVLRLGFPPARIKSIVITHHHPDHVGGLSRLKEMTGAVVIAHCADAPYIDGRLSQPGPQRPGWLRSMSGLFRGLLATAPVAVDVEVKDGDQLPAAGGIRIMHTPGHTPGSICVFLMDRGVVFAGDLMAQRFGIKLPSLPFTVDVGQLKQSIARLAGRDFGTACFGHGSAIKVEAAKRVRIFARGRSIS
jgi:glyoxylase-like metal-dependent hydrolase (beta-lactamase superfamily II)